MSHVAPRVPYSHALIAAGIVGLISAALIWRAHHPEEVSDLIRSHSNHSMFAIYAVGTRDREIADYPSCLVTGPTQNVRCPLDNKLHYLTWGSGLALVLGGLMVGGIIGRP